MRCVSTLIERLEWLLAPHLRSRCSICSAFAAILHHKVDEPGNKHQKSTTKQGRQPYLECSSQVTFLQLFTDQLDKGDIVVFISRRTTQLIAAMRDMLEQNCKYHRQATTLHVCDGSNAEDGWQEPVPHEHDEPACYKCARNRHKERYY